jgi:hypothetical protein
VISRAVEELTDGLDQNLVIGTHLVSDRPTPAEIGVRIRAVEWHDQGDTQMGIAIRISAQLVDAVEERIYDRKR